MPDKILYQKDRLTVFETKIVVGTATIFYPSVTSLNIYAGRPLVGAAISGAVGIVVVGFMLIWLRAILGGLLS
jgi:hypothetical protein